MTVSKTQVLSLYRQILRVCHCSENHFTFFASIQQTRNNFLIRSFYHSFYHSSFDLVKGGSQFVDYNFRAYTHRIAKEDFRRFASETNPEMIEALYVRGVEQLGVIQRQALNNRMYSKKLNIIDPKSRAFLEQEDAHLARFSAHST